MEKPESKKRMKWYDKFRFIFKMDLTSFIKSILMRRKDRWFDKKYGTDTRRLLKLPGNKAEKDMNWPYSLVSQSSLIEPFQKVMKELISSRIISPTDVFIDVGSGKGLILLLATSYGFHQIIGVEKFREVCEIARRNVEIFKPHLTQPYNIEIIETDASLYKIPDDATVFHLMNPFNGTILHPFMQNLCESLRRNWRHVVIIYFSPEYRKIIEETGLFELVKKEDFGPTYVVIFRTKKKSS